MEYCKGENRDKGLLGISILSNGLLLLILFYSNWRYGFHSKLASKGMYFVNVLSLIIVIIISQITVILIYKENCKIKSKNDLLEQKIKVLEEINHVNKIQRHDLKNHLTVIQGLTVRNKIDILKNYIKDLIGEVQSSKLNIYTGVEEIDIFLEAKYCEIEKNNIKLDCYVEDKLLNMSINNFDLLKVVSNIIDNAIDELKGKKGNNKKIVFEIEEKSDDFTIIIANNGKKISDDVMASIFEKGVTTKEGSDRGYGLYIVHNIIKKAKGDIRVVSNDAETKFSINIPKLQA